MFENIYLDAPTYAYDMFYEEKYKEFSNIHFDVQFDISPFGMRKEFDYPLGLVVPSYEKNDKILSIGAMNCMLSVYLSNYIDNFYAIDNNPDFLKREWIYSYITSWGMKYDWSNTVSLQHMTATNLKFGNDFFDKIISISVFEHILPHQDRLKAFQEMRRVLKPGGQIFLTIEFNTDNYMVLAPSVSGSIFSLEYLLDIVDQSGLQIVNDLNYLVNWDELKEKSRYANWFIHLEERNELFCPAYILLTKK